MPLETGETVDGMKHGPWMVFFTNGRRRSEGAYLNGLRHGPWTYYHPNGHRKQEGTFRNGLYEGIYTTYHDNGNVNYQGAYGKHTGKSSDGKKEGIWHCYCRDGETVWRIITYKRGARTKPDDYPLGLCGTCNTPLKEPGQSTCPECP